MLKVQVLNNIENGNIVNSVNFPNPRMPRVGEERLAITHKNIPNMARQITKAITEEEANILDMINKSKGGVAYTLINLENEISTKAIENIRRVKGILTVRIL